MQSPRRGGTAYVNRGRDLAVKCSLNRDVFGSGIKFSEDNCSFDFRK